MKNEELDMPAYFEAMDSIQDYFEFMDIEWKGKFELTEFCKETGLSENNAVIALCNLEDEEVMNEISDGNYDNFDITDRSIFNDGYSSMISDMLS